MTFWCCRRFLSFTNYGHGRLTDELDRRLIRNTSTLFVGTSWCQLEQPITYSSSQSLMSLFPIFNQPLDTSDVSLTALKGVVKKKKKRAAVTQKNSRTHSSLSSVQQNRFKSVHGLKTARLFGLFWSPGSLNCPKNVPNVQYVWIRFSPHSWTLCLCSVALSAGCRVSGPYIRWKQDELSYCCERKHGLGIWAGTSNSTRSL